MSCSIIAKAKSHEIDNKYVNKIPHIIPHKVFEICGK